MNWETLLAVAGTAGAVILAIMLARAERKAAVSDQLGEIVGDLELTLAASKQVISNKEDYIRELEKTVLGSLPAGKLAERLNRMFSANRGESPDPVPTPKPGTKPTDN